MADHQHIELVKRGAAAIQEWQDPQCNSGVLQLEGADLAGADLRDCHLSRANLRGANLEGARLSNAYLVHADLECARLAGAQLAGSNLTGAVLAHAQASRADFDRTFLMGARATQADFRGATLTNARLRHTDLVGADLSWARLTGSHLAGATLQSANLFRADLRHTVLSDAHGENGADLTGANLDHARLTLRGELGLELFSCTGIDRATFGGRNFGELLRIGLSQTLNPNHRARIRWPGFVESVTNQIKSLEALYISDEPPAAVVEVVQTISASLLLHLRRHPEQMYQLRPRLFEELIGEILASYGWQVQITPSSKDGGYDLFCISKHGAAGVQSSWIIECKRYRRGRPVGVEVARALYGVKSDLRVANAMLATTSHFTKGVRDFKASRYDFELKDYGGVVDWINNYQPNPNGKLYIKNDSLIVPDHGG